MRVWCSAIRSFIAPHSSAHILAFEGDSHVEWFEGNFQDYKKDKMRRLGTDSVIRHRLNFKTFTR